MHLLSRPAYLLESMNGSTRDVSPTFLTVSSNDLEFNLFETPVSQCHFSPATMIIDKAAAAAAGRTTIVHLDHMNDYKGYCKILSKWCKQLKIGGVIFLATHHKPRPRHIFTLIDAPSSCQSQTDEFLQRLRTQNVDVNMRGQPCKERMSTVVATFPAPIRYIDAIDDSLGLQIVETEGSNKSQTHMPFVRQWLQDYRPEYADQLIKAMDEHLESTTNPKCRR